MSKHKYKFQEGKRDYLTSCERAKEIVSTLYVPDDPNRWGESPVSVQELEAMIAYAIEEGIVREHDRCAVVCRDLANTLERNSKVMSKDSQVQQALIIEGVQSCEQALRQAPPLTYGHESD